MTWDETETRGQRELRRVDVPDDLVRAWRAVRDEPPVVLARQFLGIPPEEARFLVLLGKKGTGKTMAAVVVLAEVMRLYLSVDMPSGGDGHRPVPGMFVRATSMARLSAYDAGDREWFEQMCRAACLVIDDLGTELAGDIFKAQLYELLDRRHAKSKRTVITSNLDKETFAKRYGERIVDRVKERGLSEEFTGESLRIPLRLRLAEGQ